MSAITFTDPELMTLLAIIKGKADLLEAIADGVLDENLEKNEAHMRRENARGALFAVERVRLLVLGECVARRLV